MTLLLIDVVFRRNTTVLVPNNLNSDIMCPANDTRVHYIIVYIDLFNIDKKTGPGRLV